MPFNGSGTFNRVYSWVTDAANGIDVDATRTDTDSNDIASALTTCICKDGQSTPTANIPMGAFKITGLGNGTATTDAAAYGQVQTYATHLCEFRLTLTSGSAVTTGDVTAATTIYLSPYKGNKIALYSGSVWNVYASSEMSIAVPSSTSQMYDVFCYDNSGVPTLEVLAWTSDTARATALVLQDGVYVKSGAVTRRYVGSFRTTGSSGQTEDSLVKRYVWNSYNRVPRQMLATDSNASWTYSTSTIRQADGATTNQLDMVIGLSEDLVRAEIVSAVSATVAGIFVVGVGVDSTTAFSGLRHQPAIGSTVSNATLTALYEGFPGIGRHRLTWLEYASTGGTATWVGTEGGALGVSGIQGVIFG